MRRYLSPALDEETGLFPIPLALARTGGYRDAYRFAHVSLDGPVKHPTAQAGGGVGGGGAPVLMPIPFAQTYDQEHGVGQRRHKHRLSVERVVRERFDTHAVFGSLVLSQQTPMVWASGA